MTKTLVLTTSLLMGISNAFATECISKDIKAAYFGQAFCIEEVEKLGKVKAFGQPICQAYAAAFKLVSPAIQDLEVYKSCRYEVNEIANKTLLLLAGGENNA